MITEKTEKKFEPTLEDWANLKKASELIARLRVLVKKTRKNEDQRGH